MKALNGALGGGSRAACRRTADHHGFQLAHVRRVLRLRACASRAAPALDHEENQLSCGELPVLRGVESAVRDPAVGVDRGRLVCRAGPRESKTAHQPPRLDAPTTTSSCRWASPSIRSRPCRTPWTCTCGA